MLEVLLAAALAAAPKPAQLYYEQSVRMTKDQKLATSVTSRVYWSGRRMRLETGDQIVLLQLDKGRAFRLLPAEKVAVELDTDRLRSRSQEDLSNASLAIDAGEDSNLRAVPLRTPKTIAGYACEGYRIQAGDSVVDVYVSRQVPIGMQSFTEFLEWSGASQSLPGLLSALKRLPGFPLMTQARVRLDDHVYETVSTVTRLKLEAQPAALFEPPPGYRVEAEAAEEEE